ncbi:MAG: IclR family transcriptional regulator [Rhizobiaceae bacterium]|nr:IclR family transcriptional regulator [Rhizobiaceae bacterium]
MNESVEEPARKAAAGNIKTLEKGLAILDEIIDSSTPLKLSDIIRRFDIDRASAFRFLQTLESKGFLRKDAITKEYDVGGRLYYWAARLREKTRLINSFHERLQELADTVQQTAHLGLFINDRVLLADFALSTSLVAIRHKIGAFEPMHSSAAGKAILAFLPQEQQDQIIESLNLVALTRNTIVSKDALRLDLAMTRERGYAIDANETHEGLTCVARPMLNSKGKAVASVGVTSVTALVSGEPGRFEKIIAALKNIDEQILE